MSADTDLVEAITEFRVTLEQVEGSILSEHYFTATQGVLGAAIDEALIEVPEDLDVLTFCVLRLRNGYTVHGISACADPANYKRDIGERIARANAVNQIWPLLGYELKTKLSNPTQEADRTAGQAEAQPSAASPKRSEEATGTHDEIYSQPQLWGRS